MLDLPIVDSQAIVVTASRAEEDAAETPASVTVIGEERVIRLGLAQVADLLRLAPSVAVATSGPTGSLTQVRIRGAEANHTLLFVEGIRANDPAAGNEPRFELLNADLASRIEIVRGPQSALWGSEALGGVVAVEGDRSGTGATQGLIEYGSRDSWRGAARNSVGNTDRGLSIGIAGQGGDGIDSFSGHGERDGYRNLSLRSAGRYRLSPGLLLGASGFTLWGKSEFDGYDPLTFQRADTLDENRNRLAAGRLFAEVGDRKATYLSAAASLLGSSNRNRVGGDPINRTSARRRTMVLEGGHHFGNHQLIGAVEGEREQLEARDTAYGGLTDQDRSRRRQSLTAEWRASDLGPLSGGFAVRHDSFSRFKDATTFRASAIVDIGSGVSIAGNYGEGIAQPSFFDLYGFFPGSFIGNPALRPESTRGGEVSLRFNASRGSAALTYYRQRLKEEIVDVFDSATFTSSTANATGQSKRQGIELEGNYHLHDLVQLTASYAWLDASEPTVSGGATLKEQRRPTHSGSLAMDGQFGRFSYGAAITYSGRRIDTNFDLFPAQRVRLDPYWLASARWSYGISRQLEATLRVANAFDAKYEDVVGYRTEGRSVHGGLRLAFGR